MAAGVASSAEAIDGVAHPNVSKEPVCLRVVGEQIVSAAATSAEKELREVQGRVGNLSLRGEAQELVLDGDSSSFAALNLEHGMLASSTLRPGGNLEVSQPKK